MSAFSWKDTLPTAASAALAGTLVGVPMKALELWQKGRKPPPEQEQPTVVNNYYPQTISTKAAAMLKAAFGWEEVLPQAVGKGLGDLGGKLTSSAVESVWPKKPAHEKQAPKGQTINNYHIPPELLAQLAQKRGSFEGERLTAFTVGVEAFCKEAGFDDEDTTAMQDLARRVFVEKTADFGLGEWWNNMKEQGKSNPLGTVGAIGRNVGDTTKGVSGWINKAKNEYDQWGTVSEDELRSGYQKSYRNYLKQYRPEVAMRMATIESGSDKWEGEMQKDKSHFPELESDYDKWERANAGGNKPAITGSTPPAAPPATPAAPSTPAAPEPPAPAPPSGMSGPSATPAASSGGTPPAAPPTAPPAPKSTPPEPPPSGMPGPPKAPPAPAAASAPVSTTSTNVPGASTPKPKNPNAGIYVSQSGTDKSYLKNFKADGGTIGARGKASLPLPGFNH